MGELEVAGKNAEKLALMEELKTLPFSGVWHELCRRGQTPVSTAWLREVQMYEAEVLAQRR